MSAIKKGVTLRLVFFTIKIGYIAMNKLFTVLSLLFVFIFMQKNTVIFAQHTISGVVYGVDRVQGADDDEDEDEPEESVMPMPGALVILPQNGAQTITDATGNFSIQTDADTCVLVVTYTFYETHTDTVIFHNNKNVKLTIHLESAVNKIGEVSFTENRIEKNTITSTISIQKITPKTGENMNITGASELLNKVPGLVIVNDEPQIRGGSGFSSGMGSRVMILLDNMPLLRPDAGRPMWNFIPLEDVSEIEVVKGASSVVYGSSALTGAINVHTAYATKKPRTKVTLFGGIYDSPRDAYKKSWDRVNPLKWGASFSHARIIKNDFDLVLGGEYYDDQSYVGPEFPVKKGYSHEGKYETRARFNFGMRYRPSKVRGLFASLNGNFMYSDEAQSFFWYDCDTNMYRTYKGSLTTTTDYMFYVDPVIGYVSRGSSYRLQNRILYSNNEEISGAQSAKSLMVYNEFKYLKSFRRLGLSIEAGILNNYARSFGRVFSGNNYDTLPALMTSENFAAYVQLEEKIPQVKGLTIVGGARFEGFYTDSKFDCAPIFRLGVNYQIPRAFTSFRASIGQGYRYPTIGEKYISITVGSYGFYPNPDLKPEKSWNAELGIVQPFKVGSFRGMLDVAAYHQEYKNFIEFAFGNWGTTGTFLNDMGFMYLNTGPASITGVDFSLAGGGPIGKKVDFQFMLSYTYSLPVTKDKYNVYYTQVKEEMKGDSMVTVTHPYNFVSTASDTAHSTLKYRIQHTVKLDIAFTFWKKLGLNIAFSYYSSMKNVDNMFFTMDSKNMENSKAVRDFWANMGSLPFTGYKNYFDRHKYGSFVLDLSISYNILPNLKASFVIKNVLNNEYTLRPMYVEAPRSFNVQFVYGI